MATQNQKVLAKHGAEKNVFVKEVTVTMTDGVAVAGTYDLPQGSYVRDIQLETPVTIPGTPTTINFRLGSAASGQQYVADVDVKTQGVTSLTIVYAGRNPGITNYFTFTATGGTAASQDGSFIIRVFYAPPVLG